MICRLSILVISFFPLFPSILFALTLVSSGQQQAIIWISQNAGSGEEWAAREIQNYIICYNLVIWGGSYFQKYITEAVLTFVC
mgnify:CR=1 FL=1